MRKNTALLVLIFFLVNARTIKVSPAPMIEETRPSNIEEPEATASPVVEIAESSADCTTSRLGSILITEKTSRESIGRQKKAGHMSFSLMI